MSASLLEAPAPGRSGTDPAPENAIRRLLELADQCVMCGVCVPHCPTYRIESQEAESPRGRIALARGIVTGRIEPGATSLAHLDHCLACLSCQKVCPSEVRYEEIITRTRAALNPRRPRPGALLRLLRNPRRLVALARIGAAIRAHRWLPRLARALPLKPSARALAESLPDVPAISIPQSAPRPATRGRITLFRGCVASIYDRDTHAAARRLLEALGYDVAVPDGTPCCGALSRHAGEIDAADREAHATRAAVEAAGGRTVLVSASGCFGDMRDHVASTTASVEDIHAFLAGDERIETLRLRPLAARVALHLPCTQVNVVGEIAAIRSLLARIPGLTLLALPDQPRCCGAAGSYFIEHPQMASRLRDQKLDQAQAQRPDMLLTTNIGCRIHLGNGLRARDAAIPVLHPLALLAQQLENDAP